MSATPTSTDRAAWGLPPAFLSDEQAAADLDAWGRRFGWKLGDGPESYEQSVLSAAWIESDEKGLNLNDTQLRRLLEAHGSSLAQLQADAHPALNLNHAGQALAWLGY